jgi:hypothetical protein
MSGCLDPAWADSTLGLRSPRCGLAADAQRNNGPLQAAFRRHTFLNADSLGRCRNFARALFPF